MSLPPLPDTVACLLPVIAKEGAIAKSLEADGVKKNLKGQNMAVAQYKDNLIETIFFFLCLAIGENLDLKKPLCLNLLVSENIILSSYSIILDSLTNLYGICLFLSCHLLILFMTIMPP